MFPTPNCAPQRSREVGLATSVRRAAPNSPARLRLQRPPNANTPRAGTPPGRGVVNSGKRARTAAAGQGAAEAEPEPAALLPATRPEARALGQASNLPARRRAGKAGAAARTHLPLRSPARLGARTDGGLTAAAQPGGGAAPGKRAVVGRASAPRAAAGLEGEGREGAQI